MSIKNCFGLHLLLCLVIYLEVFLCMEETCNRRPLGTKTDPLPPDNRFYIDVLPTRNEYIPKKSYTALFTREPALYILRLNSVDNSSTFIGFTISVREDTAYNEKNPRKPKHLDPGQLSPSPDSEGVVVHPNCKNTVIQDDITPKTSVEALWIAPSKGNKCVTIYAVVAVKPDVWYSYEGPLSKRLCEDRRKADDMQPLENKDCKTCEEARYQVLFEGMWSANTHPQMFPTISPELVRFSDVVGASHNQYFTLYKFNSEASEGLKMLAEQGNSTKLEMEIIEKLGESVRTVIKATGPPKTNTTTVASFRVSPTHHLVSMATALLPSPDWFLGVSNMELCDVDTDSWTNKVTLNLYPLDAGTDSGMFFDSPNEDTLPPQPISSAKIAKDMPKEESKPFARLRFTLIRTYPTELCSSSTTTTEVTQDVYGGNEEENFRRPWKEPPPPPPSSEEPTIVPDITEKCPMTPWSEWGSCEGNCKNGVMSGYQTRFRHHIVNGLVKSNDNLFVVPEECRDEPTEDFQTCEEPCEETTKAPDDEAEGEPAAWYRWRRWKSPENQWTRWNRKK